MDGGKKYMNIKKYYIYLAKPKGGAPGPGCSKPD